MNGKLLQTGGRVGLKRLSTSNRSGHRTCSIKKVVRENFAKSTGKHLCQSLFFNKIAGIRPASLLKRDCGTVVFL